MDRSLEIQWRGVQIFVLHSLDYFFGFPNSIWQFMHFTFQLLLPICECRPSARIHYSQSIKVIFSLSRITKMVMSPITSITYHQSYYFFFKLLFPKWQQPLLIHDVLLATACLRSGCVEVFRFVRSKLIRLLTHPKCSHPPQELIPSPPSRPPNVSSAHFSPILMQLPSSPSTSKSTPRS